ncbi:Pescadillo [Orbilia brochopaga]|nr:Pescadillo [Drechslerella brochopaga]
MGKIKKKGVAGNASNFITRTQAVRKLQISLPDFRRLCIFKGIYPREPRNKKKANKGSTASTTFYYTKDIQWLLHEPLVQQFREHKVFSKKLTRALGRGDFSEAKRLEDLHKPRLKLDHIIRERYPSFIDALRDLDDALCTIFLFANLPANRDIPASTITTCSRLANEFQQWVIRKRALRRSFLSIKGIYYEAEIKGQSVLWLVPYKFAQHVPADVDFRIMLTFLEWYTTLMGFVLFKLYTAEGLVYPPKFDKALDEQGAGLRAILLEAKKIGQVETGATPAVSTRDISRQLETLEDKIKQVEEEEKIRRLTGDPVEEENATPAEANTDDVEGVNEGLDKFTPVVSKDGTTGDILPQPVDDDSTSKAKNMFADFTVFLSRETPRDALEFILRSFGCKRIGWDAVLGEGAFTTDDSNPSITHQIVDRPPLAPPAPAADGEDTEMAAAAAGARGKVLGRIYVQPQYIWDCVNAGRVLRPDSYAQGAELPPHLSPWDKSKPGQYDPTAPVEDNGDSSEEEEDIDEEDVNMVTNGENGVASDGEDSEEDEEEDSNEEEESEDEDDEEAEESEEDAWNGFDEEEIEDITVPSDDEEDLQHQRELEAEAAGHTPATSTSTSTAKKPSSSAKRKADKAQRARDEELDRQKAMMTKKKRKLYERMEYGNKKRQEEKERLESKRRKIERQKRQGRS